MKHLPVWSFIHLCVIFLYSVGPSVSSNASLETKCKCLNLIIGYEKFYLYAFVPPSSHLFLKKKMCVVLIGLGVSFLHQACLHFSETLKHFKDFNVFIHLNFQKTTMSSSFSFQRLQYLQSLHFQNFNAFSLYISRL